MKTDKIYGVGPEAIIELKFKQPLDYPEAVWIRLCNKHYPDEKITAVYDANNHHICKYCGGIANGIDEDILCKECRDVFGHAFFSEL